MNGRTNSNETSAQSSRRSSTESQGSISIDLDRQPDEMTPLPYPSIIALCLGRVAEGLMFSVILPYINEMVHSMGVASENVGKWSAAAVSLSYPGLIKLL